MTPAHAPFILAIAPSPRGFAFVLFEGPDSPFDWGIKELRGTDKNVRSIALIRELVSRYDPSALIVEDARAVESRRGARIQGLVSLIEGAGRAHRIPVFRYTRKEVRRTFAATGARTRPEIAAAIGARIPAFAPRVPPLRKLWMSEDPRQSLFDAAALGMTFFDRAERRGVLGRREVPPDSASLA